MDNQEKESIIRETYGNVSLESAPVDPDNPTFDSLLGALKGVYYGDYKPDILVKYHNSLMTQMEKSRQSIEKMALETPEEYKELTRDQYNISLSSIDIALNTLDLLEEYIEKPTKENLATCLESLLNSQLIMKGVHDMLDKNISQSE